MRAAHAAGQESEKTWIKWIKWISGRIPLYIHLLNPDPPICSVVLVSGSSGSPPSPGRFLFDTSEGALVEG
jgi:hypothetical protein